MNFLKKAPAILLLTISAYAQAQKPSSNGDMQGLDEYNSLSLPQDREAAKDAMQNWWPKYMKLHNQRIAWFNEARFGCFVHWGVYSLAGGEWKGTIKKGYAEHLMRAMRIPVGEYKATLVANFNPVNFNAEQWIKTAKAAGMKYMIVTAKHHDGFAMYRSDAYPYDIRMTKYKSDPMMELRTAAKKYGIKFGFYYSHAFDWEHPDAPGNDWDYKNPGGDLFLHTTKGNDNWWETYPEFLPNAEKYVNEKSIPQIKELITKYKPDVLWFDTPHKLPVYLNLKILKAVWDNDPNVLVNGRLIFLKGKSLGDYSNTGDLAAYFRPRKDIWEAVPSTNNSYGYHKYDSSYKTPAHFIRLLASAAGKGGNILLNIGPKGDGSINPIDLGILDGIGRWMHINGESIYGTTRSPLCVQPWGEVTVKSGTYYLHVFSWPKDGNLVVGGLNTHIDGAYLLADLNKTPISTVGINGKDILVKLPVTTIDTVNTVVVLQTHGLATIDSTYRLLSPVQNNRMLAWDGSVQGDGWKNGNGQADNEYVYNWTTDKQYIEWNVRVNEKTAYRADIRYALASPADQGIVNIEVDGRSYPVRYDKNTKVTQNITFEMQPGNHQIKLTAGTHTGSEMLQPMFIDLLPQ